MDHAHATCISCNAPPNMWNEFCATTAYLHNLTGTVANNGKSSYELWHSCKPPLLHLHEIGCRVFSLINTNNPKILHRSIPCILIGYAPNVKAYQLWDPTTDHIFNSFHISFIKAHHIPPPPPDSNEIQHSQLPNHPIPSIINQHPTTIKPPPNVTNTSLQYPTTHYPVQLPLTQIIPQASPPTTHPPTLPQEKAMSLNPILPPLNPPLFSSNRNNNVPFYDSNSTFTPTLML